MLLVSFHFLVSVAIFVANEGQFGLLLHTFVDFLSQLLLALFLEILDFLPSPLLDLLTIVLVALHHKLDLLRQVSLLGFQLIFFKKLIAFELLHELFVGEVSLTHEHFKLLQGLFFLLPEILETLKISLTLLLLISLLLFLERLVFLLDPVVFFFIPALHISSLLLDSLHLLVSLEFLVFALAIQIFLLLPVFEDEGVSFLLPVSLFGLDRFFQVANLVL